MYTTLNKIKTVELDCLESQGKLLKLLKLLTETQSIKTGDEPLSIATVIDECGVDIAFTCLQAVNGCEAELRLFAVWAAKQVAHLMTDERSLAAVKVAEQFALGQVSQEQMRAARESAEHAVRESEKSSAWPSRAALSTTHPNAATAATLAAWAAADVSWNLARQRQAEKLREICRAMPPPAAVSNAP